MASRFFRGRQIGEYLPYTNVTVNLEEVLFSHGTWNTAALSELRRPVTLGSHQNTSDAYRFFYRLDDGNDSFEFRLLDTRNEAMVQEIEYPHKRRSFDSR